MKINSDELSFKRSIQRTDIKSVKKFVKNKTTPGNSMIAYLWKKNYPVVAHSMADDDKTKF